MAIPTYEEYQQNKPEATWIEYVSRFSAMAAEKQVNAGEIPSDYGASHSFTDAGVWVKSGSMAAIGGLPGAIKGLFPGVDKSMQKAKQEAVEGSVITTSRAGEPQTSFMDFGGVGSDHGTSIPLSPPEGGFAPVQFDSVDRGQSQSFGNTTIGGIDTGQFSSANTGGGEGGAGIIGLLALLAMAL